MEHWAKKFFEKITPKHVQNTFGHFWERLWAFLEFWLFLILFKNISKTRHFLGTILGILGIFGILQNFWFFETISKTRPSMEHYAKRNLRKKYPKTCSKHFWTIWLWAFLDPPWNTGQKTFQKSFTPKQKTFKTRLDKLGTFLGVFWILKIF